MDLQLSRLLPPSVLSPVSVIQALEIGDETTELIGSIVKKFPIVKVGEKKLLLKFILTNNYKRIMCLVFDENIYKFQSMVIHGSVSIIIFLL